jgi:hypothetical protein
MILSMSLLSHAAEATPYGSVEHRIESCRSRTDEMKLDQLSSRICRVELEHAGGPTTVRGAIETGAFCPPENLTGEQLLAAVADAADKQHERRSEPFTTFAIEALLSEFPCE